MIEKRIDIAQSTQNNTQRKLSIQAGLNGLSFCVTDTIDHRILAFEKVGLPEAASPYTLLKELKARLGGIDQLGKNFSEVMVIHKNNMFSLVPKALFHKAELANYLKFNTKIMANDLLAYDEIPNQDFVNVYIPFTNINNYIFDLFGEFEFKHSGTVLISALLGQGRPPTEPVCYIQVSEKEMEMMVVRDKKLCFYNQFGYSGREDFLYYLLFGLEQLGIAPEKVQLKMFGTIEEGDPIFELCLRYVGQVSVFVPNSPLLPLEELEDGALDYSILSAL